MHRNLTPEQRFHLFVNVINDEDSCWEWTGARVSNYGVMSFQFDGKRIQRKASRLAWIFANGPIPDGLWVLHRCDNPPCCRVSHLFLGTAKDNAQDMVKKGRHKEQRKTHCVNGHPLSGDNVIMDSGKRRCHICKVVGLRERYHRDHPDAQYGHYYSGSPRSVRTREAKQKAAAPENS